MRGGTPGPGGGARPTPVTSGPRCRGSAHVPRPRRSSAWGLIRPSGIWPRRRCSSSRACARPPCGICPRRRAPPRPRLSAPGDPPPRRLPGPAAALATKSTPGAWWPIAWSGC
ncbi:hypothetical protein H696_06214 [Fonticula alba]|uniref:Uncharacterized protein n=1 Tax=Fonticula alba TaxID=691883 RepID=A0A058Z1G2_FONAL|nr:hypothetical protein H696_06214 [Fonticula alba]KCV67362.1 hypothetical protein H696_06214 [Fonticula alba]|eukprot:XP_009498235.1 hypothetical protein H696_06214 [Fonticula alba]